MTELEILEEADRRARRYIAQIGERLAFPSENALAGLDRFRGALARRRPFSGQYDRAAR
jgi:hypothetical protein